MREKRDVLIFQWASLFKDPHHFGFNFQRQFLFNEHWKFVFFLSGLKIYSGLQSACIKHDCKKTAVCFLQHFTAYSLNKWNDKVFVFHQPLKIIALHSYCFKKMTHIFVQKIFRVKTLLSTHIRLQMALKMARTLATYIMFCGYTMLQSHSS